MNGDHLRLSDDERDQAAAALGEHYAQGRLTPDEHAERLDRIWAARTRGELAPVFRDLPARPGPTPPTAATPWGRPVGRPAYRRGLPVPLVVLLVVLVGLTVLTHLPFVLIAVLVTVYVAARRRGPGRPRHWHH